MHISEGVLSGPVLLAGAVLAAAGTGIGLKKLNYDQIAKAGMFSAALISSVVSRESISIPNIFIHCEGSAAPQVCPIPRPPNVPMVDMLSMFFI